MIKNKNIMIIDDDSEFLDQFEEMLNLSGYATQIHLSGESALKALDQKKPNLIFLDLKMDGKSGFDVADILHNNSATAGIPIIVMSGVFSEEHFKDLMEKYGICRGLRKPLKPLDVISEIESIFFEA